MCLIVALRAYLGLYASGAQNGMQHMILINGRSIIDIWVYLPTEWHNLTGQDTKGHIFDKISQELQGHEKLGSWIPIASTAIPMDLYAPKTEWTTDLQSSNLELDSNFEASFKRLITCNAHINLFPI
ncbi:hypothetical protein ACJX0J_016951, partial [Zea mays]